jgi:hypothetical protein
LVFLTVGHFVGMVPEEVRVAFSRRRPGGPAT